MSNRNSFRLLYLLNKSKANQEGAPILLRITINGSQVSMNLGRRIPVNLWNDKTRMPKNKDAFTDDLSEYMESMRNKAYQCYTQLSKEYDDVTPEMVRASLQGVQSGSSRMLMDVWNEHNAEIEKRIGRGVSKVLWQKHRTAKRHFERFLKIEFRCDDIPLRRLDAALVRKFYSYLTVDKNLVHNSAVKILQFLKKITRRSLYEGWIAKDPFVGFSLSFEEVDRPYLTEEELELIINKEFEIERLNLIKDIFLFACYTGLAYVDVHKLKGDEIERTSDGVWWIKIRRQKTNQKSQIPLLAPAKAILDKYVNMAQLKPDERLLPVYSNQKVNSYLKEIADFCGIRKKLTFHVARHTFATTVTLQNGVSIESVSRMLGHSNIKTTQHYARVVDKKLVEDMGRLASTGKFNLAR